MCSSFVVDVTLKGEMSYAGMRGKSFLLPSVTLALLAFSDPDAGGVGGSALFGGGEGSGGVSSLRTCIAAGLRDRAGVWVPEVCDPEVPPVRLLRLVAFRDIEAERGRAE